MVPSGGFVAVNLASEALIFTLQRYKKIAKYASFRGVFLKENERNLGMILIDTERRTSGAELRIITNLTNLQPIRNGTCALIFLESKLEVN